jgi:hypothetical protein
MPRLYTKEAALAAGVEPSDGDDLINAINELFELVDNSGDITLQDLLDRLVPLEQAAGV